MLPGFLLLSGHGDGPAVEQTLRLGGPYLTAVWIGCGLGLALTFAFGWLLPARVAEGVWGGAARALTALPSAAFALLSGTLAVALSAWVSAAVLARRPALLDGVSQLVQARYFAAGRLAGPRLEDPAFWQFQFMVLGDGGWVSQYPPGFPALLAAAGRLLPLWLVGPLALGCAVGLTSLVADRLFAADLPVGRAGVLLTALSPFLAFHAAGYMSHVLALALVVLALYASLRGMDGGPGWLLVVGIALGGAFATRPYTAVAFGLVATVGIWIVYSAREADGAPAGERRGGFEPRAWAVRSLWILAGAAPFVLAALLYNRRLFGDPLVFGYLAGEGPGHGVGFHVDPWGDPYGPRQALAYTSADLQGLSLDLLQSPVPILVVVALYLVTTSRLTRGARIAAAWALAPVAAQALYWHHDLFMGPRLLYEAAPGWCLLFSASAAGLVRALPEQGRRFGLARSGVGGALAFGLLLALLYAGPAKLASYRAVQKQTGMDVSAPPTEGPALVFVHGTWSDRVAARLAAAGMRVDSIRMALAHNPTCGIELYLESVEDVGREARPADSAAASAPPLAFAADRSRTLRDLRMPSGSVVRTYEGEKLAPPCEREAGSDFEGAVGLPPLLWRGDLPGLGSAGSMFVRDLGPGRNDRLLAEFPERRPFLLVRRGGDLRVEPYDEGERTLWLGS